MTEKHIYIDAWNPMENRIDVVQGEASARYVVAHIHHSGVPLNLDGASVQVYGTKPDGTGILNDCEVVDATRGQVSIPMTQQMSIAPGEYEEAGLQIIREGKILKVLGLSIVVHPAYDYDEDVSEDELSALQEAIDRSNYAASRVPSIGENGNWYIGNEDTGTPVRGTAVLQVETPPIEESSTVDGYSYNYKFTLSTVMAESRQNEVLIGDIIRHGYYEYSIGYVGKNYAFASSRETIQGEPGYTPVKGVDYYTDSDKSEFSEYIASELAKRAQLKPEFANSIEECTDTSKLYVLPDGYIYAYMLTEVEAKPSYTNRLPLAIDTDGSIFNGTGYKNGYRLNSSATEKEQAGCGHTGFIPVKNGDVIRLKNYGKCTTGYQYIHFYKSDFGRYGTSEQDAAMLTATDVYSYTIAKDSYVAYIRISVGEFNSNSIITVNEEITESGGTVTEYAWANTGRAFVPADYEDRIVALENEVTDLKEAVDSGVAIVDNSMMFISPDGNDSNDGLTANTPKKTVNACVNAGAKKISAKRGVYNEIVQLWNIGELKIFPTDNDKTYVVGEDREPIVFDTSDSVAVSSLAVYNSIKRVAYTNLANTQFEKVFTKQSQPPIYGESEYGSRYNATVWLLSEDEKTVCIKLKPVLTVAECEAETNTFTFDGSYIYINADTTSVAKIIVPTNWGTGFRIEGAQKVTLCEVEVRFSGAYNIDIRACVHFDFYKCACKYTSYGSGFHPYNSNGIMRSCYATKNYDGYGISGHGHTTYIDCVSEFNFDDGMSHHNACEGTVIGGRYEGNGKGGNTPAYGAKVNIYGGLYKDNASFGIGYLWASDLEPASGMVQGAVMIGNPVGLVVNANCPVTAMSCVYRDNSADKENNGLLTEY